LLSRGPWRRQPSLLLNGCAMHVPHGWCISVRGAAGRHTWSTACMRACTSNCIIATVAQRQALTTLAVRPLPSCGSVVAAYSGGQQVACGDACAVSGPARVQLSDDSCCLLRRAHAAPAARRYKHKQAFGCVRQVGTHHQLQVDGSEDQYPSTCMHWQSMCAGLCSP